MKKLIAVLLSVVLVALMMPVVSFADSYCSNDEHRCKVVEMVPATCTTNGVAVLKCIDCDYTVTEIVNTAPGHNAQVDSDISVPPTCTEEGQFVYFGTCTVCGEALDGKVVTIPATGHVPTGEQTCTTGVTCSREGCGAVLASALGHTDIADDGLNDFFCDRCGEATDETVAEKLDRFNQLTAEYKQGSVTGDSEVKYITRTDTETEFKQFDYGIYTSTIRNLYEEEYGDLNSVSTAYTAVSTGSVKGIPVSAEAFSRLTADDVDSVTVEKLSGITGEQVLSDFDTEYEAENVKYNISAYKNVQINAPVIKVTIDVKDENIYALVNNNATETALQKITDTDIRDKVNGYSLKNDKFNAYAEMNGNGELTGDLFEIKVADFLRHLLETEPTDDFTFSIDSTIENIETDAVITYYLLEATGEPVMAVYDVYDITECSNKTNFTHGISIKGYTRPVTKTLESTAYIFDAAEAGDYPVEYPHEHTAEIEGWASDAHAFFCSSCGEATDETAAAKLENFNKLTAAYKTDTEKMYGTVRNFTKSYTANGFKKLDFGEYTSIIEDMYKEEMGKSEPNYSSGVRTTYVRAMPVSAAAFSTLEPADIDSVTVERFSGLKGSEVFSSFNPEYKEGTSSFTYFNSYKALEIDSNVVKVTINVKNESLYDVVNNNAEETALMKIYNFDIRDQIEGYVLKNGKYTVRETETGDGYKITMDATVESLETDAVVTFYFLEESYEPVMVIYDLWNTMDLAIEMNMDVGVSVSGDINSMEMTHDTSVFVFSNTLENLPGESQPSCAHSSTRAVRGVAATCESFGWTAGVYCNDCGCYISGREKIDKFAHENAYSEVYVAATCTAPGYSHGLYCPDCKAYLSESYVIPSINHKNAYTVNGTPATCTEAGLADGTFCPDCNEYIVAQEEIPALNHKNAYTVGGTPATCYADGITDGTYCPDCRTYIAGNEVIPALNHKNAYTVGGTPATCYTDGITDGTYCPDCRTYIAGNEAIPALNHKNAYTVNGTPATCTEAGLADGTFCPDCNEYIIEQKEIPATGHKYTYPSDEKDATCVKPGYTAGVYCLDCKTYIEGHEEIPALNHKNAYDVAAVPATCMSAGFTAGKYCPDCNTYTEGHESTGVDKDAHIFSTKEIVLPSCTLDGYTTYICSCGYRMNGDATDMTGHEDADADNTCDACGVAMGGSDAGNDDNDKDDSQSDALAGIMKILQKILDFFRKLFGISIA